MFLSDLLAVFAHNLRGFFLTVGILSVTALLVVLPSKFSGMNKILAFLSLELLAVLVWIAFLITVLLPHPLASAFAGIGVLEIVLFVASFFLPRVNRLVFSPVVLPALLLKQKRYVLLTLLFPLEMVLLLFPLGTLVLLLH